MTEQESTIAIYETGRSPRVATLQEIDRLKAVNAELVAAFDSAANALAFIWQSRAVPKAMRPGLMALEDEMRAAIAKAQGDAP